MSDPRVRALVGPGPSLCCAADVHCLREKVGKGPCRIQEQVEAWLSGSELCYPLQTLEGQEKGQSHRCRKAFRLGRPMGVFQDLGQFQLCRGLEPEGVGLGSLG